MLEHITRAVYYVNVHLLYASFVWCAAWLVTSIPSGSATTKYWIWVATSLNFMLPVGSVLDKLGSSHLSWARPLGVIGDAIYRVSHGSAALDLSLVWLLGVTVLLTRLCLRLRDEHRDTRTTAGESACNPGPTLLAHGVPIKFARTPRTPAVLGVLRPHISLPSGIDRLLNKHELNAVLIHELTHAKRRDNLIRLVHEVGLCLLWFHPLIWITGWRLALYRELSCDESVIQSARGGDLVSALAKLANPADVFVPQATASSFLGHRLARLAAASQQPASRTVSTLLAVTFAAALLGGVFGTVAHTACCFFAR